MLDNDIVIISNYPNDHEVREGMMQRVINIDNFFLTKKRTYLSISLRRNLEIHSYTHNNNLSEHRLHIFKHYFFIKKVLQSTQIIYVHSIYNFLRLLPFLPYIRKKNIILDFHGIVPEELKFMGHPLKASFYKLVEKIAIVYSKHIIFVTQSMQKYIISKYGERDFCPHILNIFTKNVLTTTEITPASNHIKAQYGIQETDTVFIYSGNTQKWQNIDLMLSFIQQFKECENYKFIILTGEIELFQQKINAYNLHENNNIFMTTVLPEDLHLFYSISHYGFILRDDHILNRVANPTKLVEYMWFGVIPIVKLEQIGDYQELHYECINIQRIDTYLAPRKSQKNIDIIKKLSSSTLNMNNLL